MEISSYEKKYLKYKKKYLSLKKKIGGTITNNILNENSFVFPNCNKESVEEYLRIKFSDPNDLDDPNEIINLDNNEFAIQNGLIYVGSGFFGSVYKIPEYDKIIKITHTYYKDYEIEKLNALRNISLEYNLNIFPIISCGFNSNLSYEHAPESRIIIIELLSQFEKICIKVRKGMEKITILNLDLLSPSLFYSVGIQIIGLIYSLYYIYMMSDKKYFIYQNDLTAGNVLLRQVDDDYICVSISHNRTEKVKTIGIDEKKYTLVLSDFGTSYFTIKDNGIITELYDKEQDLQKMRKNYPDITIDDLNLMYDNRTIAYKCIKYQFAIIKDMFDKKNYEKHFSQDTINLMEAGFQIYDLMNNYDGIFA